MSPSIYFDFTFLHRYERINNIAIFYIRTQVHGAVWIPCETDFAWYACVCLVLLHDAPSILPLFRLLLVYCVCCRRGVGLTTCARGAAWTKLAIARWTLLSRLNISRADSKVTAQKSMTIASSLLITSSFGKLQPALPPSHFFHFEIFVTKNKHFGHLLLMPRWPSCAERSEHAVWATGPKLHLGHM